MGQRTQIGVNLRYIEENGTEHIERAIFHYQWGGYSNIMFENLISLFLEVRNYIYELKDERFGTINQTTNDNNLKKQNFLKIIIDKLISKECKKITKDKKTNLNDLSEKEFWSCVLTQDCDDGRILVDILLDKEKSYCKWNFLKNESSGLDFKKVIKNELTYNPYEIDYNEELENKIFFCIENFKNIDLEMAKRNNNFEILCKIYGKLDTEKNKENFEKMSKVMESLDDFFEDKNIINGIEKNMIEFINQDFIKEKIKNGKYDFFKYKSATVSNKFDTKTFKKENPSIYQNYIKEVEVVTNDSIRGKIIKYTPFMEIENREIAKLEENFENFKAKISENVTDEELKGISTMRNKLVQVKEELENQSIVDTETLLRMIEENNLKELPTIDTKHFYFLRGKKTTQQRINKKLLEFEHPELLEKYTKSEEVEEKVEFK